MGILESLESQSYKAKTRAAVSNCWRLLGVQASELKWFENLQSSSVRTHEQVVLIKTPEEATGHEGIAHGGLIAALLDEALCFGAYPVLPHHTGVTASLKVDYYQPTPAGSWILIHSIARTPEEGSRKAIVDAEVYTIDINADRLPWESESKPNVKATQVVVEPRWYEKLTHK